MTELAKKKKASGPSPTARTLAECRKRGWLAQTVEQRIPHTFITRDLFNFGDVLALDCYGPGEELCFPGLDDTVISINQAGAPRMGSLLIQTTADNGGNVAKRADKIRSQCRAEAIAWLERGNRIEVWGWGKRGKEGKRKLWTLRIVSVTLADFIGDTPQEVIADDNER